MGEYRKEREAGRALDAIIAERVMGYVWTEWRADWHRADGSYDGDEWSGPPMRDGMVLRCGLFGPTGPPGRYCGPPPRFSTDTAAAFEVVYAMRAKGFRWRIGAGSENPDHAFAAFWRPNGFFVQHDAEAETPALAICLAALAMLDDPDERTPEKAQLKESATPPSPSTEEHE